MSTAIKFENVSKQYRLGEVGTGTLSHDLHRAWAKLRGKPDPFAKVGAINDRTQSAPSTSSLEPSSSYVWALKDINFEVEQGEILGIIGRNGAGKSTLLKLLSRVTAPTTGSIKAKGRIASLLEVGTGFHPELTGRENIYLNGAILGMRRHEITKQLDAIVDFSGCAKYVDTPVKRYSSGMTVRLGFAVAAHLDCEILVVDEVLAVGDLEFQKKCIGKMQDVSRLSGKTVLFVSHNLGSLAELCTRGVVLNQGCVHVRAETGPAIQAYLGLGQGGVSGARIFDVKEDSEFAYLNAAVRKDGTETVRFAIDEPIQISAQYKLRSNITGLELAIAIYNSRGIRVFTTERSSYCKSPMLPGTRELTILVPGSTLVPDMYSVQVAAYVPNSRMISNHPDSLAFEVYDSGFHFSRYNGTDIGMVLLNCEWVENSCSY